MAVRTAADLPVVERRQIEDGLWPDRWKNLKGPNHPGKWFEERLQTIDRRLVLRWNPWRRFYEVYILFAWMNKTWVPAVHTIHDGNHRYRQPSNWDIQQIQRANWNSQHSGAKGYIESMDRYLKFKETERKDERYALMHDEGERQAKKHDFSYRYMGVPRGAIFSGVPSVRG